MTDDKIALRQMLEKGSDATFLREMIGFAAQRLMELGVGEVTGAGAGASRSSDWMGRRCGLAGMPLVSPPRRSTWRS